MKKNGMIIFCLLVSKLLIAQNEPASVLTSEGYYNNPAEYLSQINKSNIATNVLIDNDLFEDNVFDFNGIDRVKTTDFIEWSDFYTTLKYANVDTSLQSEIEIIKKISKYSYIESNTYTIGILSFRFNQIKQQALDNGEFTQGANYLADINSSVNSYSTHRLISSSCLYQNIYGDDIKFLIPDYLFISNLPNEEVEQIHIDFGNGEGYKTVNFNEPIIISYSSLSQYELCKVKISLKDLSTNKISNFYSHFTFFRTGSSTVPLPDPTHNPVSLKSISTEVIPEHFRIEFPEAERKTVQHCVKIPRYSTTECRSYEIDDYSKTKIHAYFLFSSQTITEFPDISNAKLRRPIIVCDGFDPGNKRDYYKNDIAVELDMEKDFRGLFQLLNGDPSPWYSEEPSANLIERLRADGYDIVIVNFLDGAGNITENAGENGLRGFLNLLNSAYRDSKTEEAVLIGPSMGGLITRHALTSMEQANPVEEHYVKLWFSFDSPQKGAYIPLGLQHSLAFLSKIHTGGFGKLKKAKESFEQGKNTLNTTAAKQMLIYHYLKTSDKGYSADEFFAFYTNLNNLGFPEYSKNYAISNGGTSKLYETDKSKIMDFEIFSYTWANAWSNSNSDGNNKIFEGSRQGFNNDEEKHTNSQIAFENAPGGWNSSLYSFNCNSGNKNEKSAANKQYTRATFMVTASTFGMEVTRGNVHNTWQDYANINGIPSGKIVTPFDEIHGMTENEEHVRISKNTADYLIDEVLRPEFENTQRPVARNGHTINQKVSGDVAYTVKENISFGGNGNTFTIENGANINVSAGSSITFKPGFSIKSGANFIAKIQVIDYGTVLKYASTSLSPVDYTKSSPFVNKIYDYSHDNENPGIIPQPLSLNVYPNPVNDYLNIDFKNDSGENLLFTIYDIMGSQVLSGSISASGNLDLSNLNKGIYFVRIYSLLVSESKNFKITKL